MTNYYTENLTDFGYREIKILRDILSSWIENGLPDGFENIGVKPALNMSSECVFLTNDDYQVAMLNDDNLEIFHNLPYSGNEGFLDELIADCDPKSLNEDDLEYIRNAAEVSGVKLNGNWLK